MSEYNIPVDQWDEYKESVHSKALYDKKDLSAPVCNDCHGNHGANPPEITSIAYVCHQCHPSTGELFSASPHKEAYEVMEISECEACHGNHRILRPTDDMLGTGEAAVCIQCHDPDTKPYQIASTFKSRLDGFVERLNQIDELLDTAEKKGVEVSEPKFRLTEASTALVLVRNLTHSLDLPEFEEEINKGEKVLAEVQGLGEDALQEAKFRRTGLVIATVFILLLAIALFLKIRQIEKAPSK
jgi:predicted CXXCH cytochrome family protein